MSIADKLQRIIDTKDDIRDAIEAKGRDLTNKTFEDDYAAEIAAIETGGGGVEVVGQEVLTGEFEESIVAGDTVSAYYTRSYTGQYGGILPILNGTPWTSASTNNYVVFGTSSSPFFYLFKKTGATTISSDVTTIDIPPATSVFSSSFSSDETYLAVGATGGNTPVLIYKRSGDDFTKLAAPNVTTTLFSIQGLKFSNDNEYLYVMAQTQSDDSVFMILKRTGDTFDEVQLFNRTYGIPLGGIVAESPDGKYIMYNSSTGQVRLIKREVSVFTEITIFGSLTGNGLPKTGFITSDYKIFVSLDDSNIVHEGFQQGSWPRRQSYQINSNDTITPIDNIVKGKWTDFRDVALDATGNYMVGTHWHNSNTTPSWLPKVTFYKKVNGYFWPTQTLLLTTGSGLPTNFFTTNYYTMTMSPDATIIAIGSTASPRRYFLRNDVNQIALKIHKINNEITDSSLFNTNNSAPIGAGINSTVPHALGYALEDGAQGEQKTMMSLFRD